MRVAALLGDWSEAGVVLKCGSSRYRLRSVEAAAEITMDGAPVSGEWIELVDDGREHVVVFPPRRAASDVQMEADCFEPALPVTRAFNRNPL